MSAPTWLAEAEAREARIERMRAAGHSHDHGHHDHVHADCHEHDHVDEPSGLEQSLDELEFLRSACAAAQDGDALKLAAMLARSSRRLRLWSSAKPANHDARPSSHRAWTAVSCAPRRLCVTRPFPDESRSPTRPPEHPSPLPATHPPSSSRPAPLPPTLPQQPPESDGGSGEWSGV